MCTTFHLHEFRTHVLSRAVMLCAAILSMIFIMVGHVSVLARYNPVLAGLNHTAQLYFELWRLEYVVDDKEKIHQTYSGGQQVSITVPRIFLSVGLCCSFCTVIVSAVLLVVRFSQQQQMNMDCTIAAFSEMVNSNALGPSVRTMRRRASLEMAYLQARDQHRYAVDRLWGILLVCVSSFTVLAVVIFLATFRVFYSSNITTLNSTEKRSHLCAGYWLVCVSVVLLVFVGATSVVTPLTGTYIIKWLGEPPALTREGIRENGQQQQSRSASSWWVSGDTPFATAAASAPPPVVGDEDALSPATGGANRKRSRARWAYVSVPVIEDGSSMPVHHLHPVTGVELDEP